jgi:hypothetical protein
MLLLSALFLTRSAVLMRRFLRGPGSLDEEVLEGSGLVEV